MKMDSVDSSFIKEIGWENERLRVIFYDGITFDYLNVTEDAYKEFKNASSVGSHFHRKIKNAYHAIKKVN